MARPTTYTKEKADQLCEYLANGESLRTACAHEDMPDTKTVFNWMRANEDFAKAYAVAKQEASDAMAEDILDIADDGTNDWMERERKDGSTYLAVNGEAIQRSRLRVDTRKWLMSKMKPKKYGDKLDLTSAGEKLEQAPLVVSTIKARDATSKQEAS